MQFRIESKDALLHAIHERYIEEAADKQTALMADPSRWEGRSLDEVVNGSIRALAGVMTHDARPRRALALRAASTPTRGLGWAAFVDGLCAMAKAYVAATTTITRGSQD